MFYDEIDEEEVDVYQQDTILIQTIFASILNDFNNIIPNRRGNKTYDRKRVNDPFECIKNGMNTLEFKRLFRISIKGYKKLHTIMNLFYPISQDTRGRPRIANSTRIGLSLYFFGHLVDYVACATVFGIAASTAFDIVEEFVDIFVVKLKNRFVQLPQSVNDIHQMAVDMMALTDLKGAVAAVDGTHIPIQLPYSADSRSFYSFKGFYSSLAVVMCDIKYKIIRYSVGHTGCNSDSTIVI